MVDRKIIEELAAEELVDANAKHDPKFHSPHEAYAVTLEEFEETKNEVDYMEFVLTKIWQHTKDDANADEFYRMLKNSAINAARDAIQVVAMCDKALKLY